MKRVVALAACCSLVAAAAAMAATTQKVTVTPSSGSTGTTFTIAFLTPSAAPKRSLHVHGAVANAGSKNGCTTTLDFFNPKKEAANQHLKFAFKVTADEGLCIGRWTVTVKRGGRSILPRAHFTLH